MKDLLAILPIAVLSIAACSPTMNEGSYPIAGSDGFQFFDAGGDEKMILDGKVEKKPLIVIESRVDSYLIKDGQLLVARTPRVLFKNSNGTLDGRLEKRCEIWSVDLGTRAVKRIDGQQSEVRCR